MLSASGRTVNNVQPIKDLAYCLLFLLLLLLLLLSVTSDRKITEDKRPGRPFVADPGRQQGRKKDREGNLNDHTLIFPDGVNITGRMLLPYRPLSSQASCRCSVANICNPLPDKGLCRGIRCRTETVTCETNSDDDP